MRKLTKFWLLSAASLIALGGVTFTITGCSIAWDFNKFSTTEFETNTYIIDEFLDNIRVNIKKIEDIEEIL